MKGNRSPYQLRLFTLRMWLEQVDQESFEWRGEVKNTSTGETRYFRTALALYDALQKLLETPAQESTDDTETDPETDIGF